MDDLSMNSRQIKGLVGDKIHQMMNHMGLPSERSSNINDGESFNPNGNVVDDFTSIGSQQLIPPNAKDQYVTAGTRNEAVQQIDESSEEDDDSAEDSAEDISKFNAKIQMTQR